MIIPTASSPNSSTLKHSAITIHWNFSTKPYPATPWTQSRLPVQLRKQCLNSLQDVIAIMYNKGHGTCPLVTNVSNSILLERECLLSLHWMKMKIMRTTITYDCTLKVLQRSFLRLAHTIWTKKAISRRSTTRSKNN